MSEILLKTENLIKTFTTTKDVKLEILKSISFEIVEGKITLILGASGAGKSTLLHLLGGLDKPDSGKIYFKGENILEFPEKKITKFRNMNIGFVFQFHHLLPEFTALENVAIPQMILGTSLKKASEKANTILDEVGLSARKNHKPAELSGGEQQRVAVARALANAPQIILADEPTGNLDSVNSQIVSDLIVQLNKKYQMTFVVVTHNMEIPKIADSIYEMKDGKIFKR
jgi:lipoprotein-releasing system ATP-binding protein